jgi:glycosyltransferase involved in cell wall biosynthesis
MPIFQKSADILVIPNSGKEDISRLYTSPMKLFEYMASGVPVVASDLPSIREILSENNSVLFIPDDANSLADAIKKILGNPALADKISKQALSDVQKYTWNNRAKEIISFITKNGIK